MLMSTKDCKDRASDLAIKVALRAALFGLPSPRELQLDYGISRATAYRLRRRVQGHLLATTPAVRAA